MSRTNHSVLPVFNFRKPPHALHRMSVQQEAEIYILRLADGQSWVLHFPDNVKGWGRTFASIMGLTHSRINRGHTLIFVDSRQRDGSAAPSRLQIERPAMSRSQNRVWTAHDPGPVRIWSEHGLSEKVIELFYLSSTELQTISMSFSLSPVHQAVISNGGLPFHAALLTRNGAGVLIAASGGGGKSTCAARIPKPWRSLCDDETVIVRDGNGRYVVHPFPTWSVCISGRSHKTWDVQRYVPLRAIFFLEQSEKDTIVEISKTQATARAYTAAEQVSAQSFRGLEPSEARVFRHKLFENACDLIEQVQAYVLRASLTGRFWEEIERVLDV